MMLKSDTTDEFDMCDTVTFTPHIAHLTCIAKIKPPKNQLPKNPLVTR